MEEFVGTKFKCIDEKLKVDSEIWWTTEYKVVKQFVPTPEYKQYLRQKRKEELALKISVLKHKLDMQCKLYGEVDPVDEAEFHFYVQQYCKL